MAHRILTLVILSATLVAVVGAQSIGRITGTVTDNTGAAVTDAAVEVVNVETGEVRRVTTNASGTYSISPIPVGAIGFKSARKGSKSATRSEVRVDVNSTATIDVHLEIGSTD